MSPLVCTPLLDASVIYAGFVAACRDAGIRLKYAVHMTGHGWRKLMRLDRALVYRITEVPPVPDPVMFMMERGPVDLREAYATFNMGAGFAAFVDPADAQRCIAAAQSAGYCANLAGTVLAQANRKAVEIVPLGITFDAATLQVR